MHDMVEVSWQALKSNMLLKGIQSRLQWVLENDTYKIFLFDNPMNLACSIKITKPKNNAQHDFETLYKDKTNKILNPVDYNGNLIQYLSPFASKSLKDGKLFRRLHGVTANLAASGDTTVEYSVPYSRCKITGIQIVWAPEGVTVDLEVLDTPSGAISSVPNLKLNQFGFNAPISEGFHKDVSSYDADLIKDMKIRLTFHNSSQTSKLIGIGLILHEII